MIRLFSIPFFLCITISCFAQTYSRIKIDLKESSIITVANLGLETDHGFYAPGKFLINEYSERELALLRAADVSFDILVEDVLAHYEATKHLPFTENHARNSSCDGGVIEYETPRNYQEGSMGGFLTYDELLQTLDQMSTLYPNLITSKKAIGNYTTQNGNEIYYIKVSDNPNDDEIEENQIIYTALHHAREPGSLSQMIFYIWYLLENYKDDLEIQYIVDNTELYFMPCVNPDGYEYNESIAPNGGGRWRKNRRDNGNSTGVDLNRNYGFNWGWDDGGSSPDGNSEVYRGTEAFSEPETQAVKDLCEANNFKIALNYHSFGNLLIHPWGYNDALTDVDSIFKAMGNLMIEENNYKLGTGVETVGYVVNGD
ncbi:MAG: M14 family metallopeptidase, partial [Bacteroidota bacterium]